MIWTSETIVVATTIHTPPNGYYLLNELRAAVHRRDRGIRCCVRARPA